MWSNITIEMMELLGPVLAVPVLATPVICPGLTHTFYGGKRQIQ